MPKIRPKVMITERDEAIFQRVYEQRTMLVKQIVDQFFASTHLNNAYNRIFKLEKNGYLESRKTRINGRWYTHVYTTEKSLSYVKDRSKFEITLPILKSSSVNHDIALVDLRTSLEKMKMVKETICENILQTTNCEEEVRECDNFRVLNTDLAVHIDNGHGCFWIPFEWEATDKGRNRLMEKLISYYTISEIPAIVYICANKSIQNNLKKCDEEICKDFSPKLFTCLLNDVLNLDGKLKLSNLKNEIFLIE